MKRDLKIFVLALVIMVGLFFILFTEHGHSAQIRIDTGDLRYCFLGIPYQYKPLNERYRNDILSITSRDPTIGSMWYTCARFPLPTSNNTHTMAQSFYGKAAAWVKVDRNIASMVIKDIITYIKTTECREGLPASSQLVSGFVVFSEKEGYKVDSNWRNSELVESYLKEKGLLPK